MDSILTAIAPDVSTLLANLLIGVITALIGIAGTAVTNFLKSKLNAQQLETLGEIAAIAVNYAEQKGLVSEAIDKKSEALKAATDLLADRGIRIDPAALDAAIESAVLEQFNRSLVMERTYQKAQAA